MLDFSTFNKGIGFFILAIDAMTRFVWTRPVASLKSIDVSPALRSIFDEAAPMSVRSDRGSEYISSAIAELFKEYNIKHFTTSNTETKAHFAEHGIKVIKKKLYRAMDHKKSKKWIDLLAQVTDSYNKTPHSVLGVSPAEAVEMPDPDLRKLLYYDKLDREGEKEKISVSLDEKTGERTFDLPRRQTFRHKVGEAVVISAVKTAFHKGYLPQWSGEVFFVTSREVKQGHDVYRIKSWENEAVEGTFYGQELSAVTVPDDTTYVVEKILDRRKKGGRDEVLVRWVGFPDSHITWVASAHVVNNKVLKRRLLGNAA